MVLKTCRISFLFVVYLFVLGFVNLLNLIFYLLTIRVEN